MIKTLKELYRQLSTLFCISSVCQECQFDDCKGYLWLLPEEAEDLYQRGVEILEVNNHLSFINPFINNRPVDIEEFKPDCPLCQNRRCLIYRRRPLVCRMYPLNFAKKGDKFYLVLHLDCRFSQQQVKNPDFLKRVATLFGNISPELLEKILDIYQKFDSISKFPKGPNRYHPLFPLDTYPARKGGMKSVKVQSCP